MRSAVTLSLICRARPALILIGGSILFVAACALELIINGVLGYLVVQEHGFGVPFRFSHLGYR